MRVTLAEHVDFPANANTGADIGIIRKRERLDLAGAWIVTMHGAMNRPTPDVPFFVHAHREQTIRFERDRHGMKRDRVAITVRERREEQANDQLARPPKPGCTQGY